MCKEAVITKRTVEFDDLHTLLIRVVGSNPRTFLLGGDCADGCKKLQQEGRAETCIKLFLKMRFMF